MIEIRHPTLVDLLSVVARARADEVAEYEAMRGVPFDPARIAAGIFSSPDVVMQCLYNDGTPVAVAGFFLLEHQVWRAFMFGTDEAWAGCWRAITKAVRRTMAHLLDTGAARVIELRTTTDRTRAQRWYVKGLRMQFEGVLRKRCANGQDVAVFSREKGMA